MEAKKDGSKSKEKNFVSCIIYLHNDADTVKAFLRGICGVMQEHFEKYEIVCVNDGCTDDTVEQIHAFLEEQESARAVSLINMSFYQGVETAMNAGGDLAVGDFLFEFDRCSLDFDPELIMQVYRRALEGYDVVAAAPKHGVSFTSQVFYAIYNWSSRFRYRIRQERFRIVSRRAVNRVNQMNIYVPYRKAMYVNCGLKTDTIVYDNKEMAHKNRNREERGNRSGLAVDTLVIFTDVLERFSMLVSMLLLGFLLIMFGWIVYSIFSEVRPVEGWLSLMALMSFGFFMLSVLLTLIFKYLSIILNMSFKRQRYVVEGVEKLAK
jgi:dolichol-phosphate mannosyltransferase